MAMLTIAAYVHVGSAPLSHRKTTRMSACPHEAVPPSTRVDLEGITKLSALQKRARDAGVDGAKVDEAVDAEDPRQVLIELIIEKATSQVDPAAALRAELGGITKLSTLQKRARDACVDGGASLHRRGLGCQLLERPRQTTGAAPRGEYSH